VPGFIATIDTSVLVSLQSADLLGAVSVLFDRLLVPVKVREELRDGGEKNSNALKALEEFAFFEHCDDYDRVSVELLLQTREHLREGRDEGEAEAVVQAAQKRAEMVLTDDPLGRTWAQKHTLDCHGTIWICYHLRKSGFLTELRPHYVCMLQSGRRQPVEAINQYLREFGEALITQDEYLSYTKK
jgi:predicted nucleic acid-binding protein